MTTIREKIQEIIHDNFEIYGDGTVKMRPDNAEIQLEALFKEEWLGMVGENEKDIIIDGHYQNMCRNEFRSELRAKVEEKI